MAFNVYITKALANIFRREFSRPIAVPLQGDVIMVTVDRFSLYGSHSFGNFLLMQIGEKSIPVNTNHIIAMKEVDDEKPKLSIA